MFEWMSSAKEYLKIFKDLKAQLPQQEKNQEHPEEPQAQNSAADFLWNIKQVYGKVKNIKQVNIPQLAFLKKLDQMPNDKEQFRQEVRANMLETRNNKLCIKHDAGESEPIGDFSNKLLNDIENWALALFGTFGKK